MTTAKNDRTDKIIKMFLRNEFTYEEIGKAFGISRQRVGQILSKNAPEEIVHSRKKRKTKFINENLGPWIRANFSEVIRKLTPIEKILMRCNWENDCLVWMGPLCNGYGRVVDAKGRASGTHRIVYEAFHGRPCKEYMVIDHLCMNKRCVNPAHLEEVTPYENTRRYWETVYGTDKLKGRRSS